VVEALLKRADGIVRWYWTARSRQMSKLFAFLKDESGATAIEYGLIAAGISVVIIASVNAIGSTLNAKFDFISTQLR
jgi:pilus assembly protein Flp/PilA